MSSYLLPAAGVISDNEDSSSFLIPSVGAFKSIESVGGFSVYWVPTQEVKTMKKNVASQVVGAQMINSADGTAFTGTASVSVTIDGGTQTAGGGTVTHEGSGYHTYAPTQAETNGDHIGFTFTGSGAINTTVQVYTSFPQSADNNTLLSTIDTKVDDIPTVAEFNARTLLAADYFDPTTDAVATVTSVTNAVTLPTIPANWITASGIAASALDNKGNWNVGKTGYSISGTKTTLDALNDIAATSIVSGGAINTTAGAVDNVTLVATTTTNTDMRGTDNALLASAAPTNFGDMAITATTGQVTVGTNNDKTGYSISGTITTLDGLNNFNPTTDTVTNVTNVTSELNVNVAKINGVTVIGNGSAGNLWRA